MKRPIIISQHSSYSYSHADGKKHYQIDIDIELKHPLAMFGPIGVLAVAAIVYAVTGSWLVTASAAAVMLFGNAPKTSGHGVNGANVPAFGGPYAHVLPIALLCIVVLFSVRDGLLENTSNAMLRGVVPDE